MKLALLPRLLALSLLAAAPAALAQTATLTSSAGAYTEQAGSLTLTATVVYPTGETPTSVGFTVALPSGWAFVSQTLPSGASTLLSPAAGEQVLEWAFSGFPATQLQWTFVVSFPAGLTGNQTISVVPGQSTYRPGAIALTVPDLVIAEPDKAPSFTAPGATQPPATRNATVEDNVTLTALATGNPAPTYQWRKGGNPIANATNASLTLNAVKSSDAGTYDVVATNRVTSATSTATVLSIAKKAQTITFGALTAKTFGDPAFALTATASSGLTVSYTSSNPAVASVSGSTVTILGAGTTEITASQAGNDDYLAATSVAQSLVVNKAVATIALGGLAATFDGTPKAVTATTTPPGIPVVITYDAGATVPTAVGSYAVVATINSPNYQGSQSGTLVIAKGEQTITFAAVGQKVFTDGTLTLAATASSGLPVSFTSSNPAVATVTGNTVTFVAVGTTTLTASQAGNANYNAAPNVGRDLEIVPALQTITFAALPAKAVGDAPFALGATASSGLAVSYTSSNAAVATVSGNTVTIVGAGTTTITATQAGNANFGAAPPVPRDLVVNKGTAPIVLGGLAATFDGSAKAATATTTPAGLTVTFTYTPTGGAPSATPPTNAGSYAVAATVVDNNYEGTQSGTLVIAKATQTITFGALAAKTFGDAAFALTATASSGLPVSYASSNPAVATVSGATVTIIGAGTAEITASQAGGDNHLAATSAAQSLVVNKAAATVALGGLAATFDGTPKAVTATTTPPGIPVVITYDAGATVPTAVGSYAVVATINSPNYQGSQSGTLVIAKGEQTITFAALGQKVFTDGTLTLSATASSGLPVSFTSSNPAVATVTGNTVTFVAVGTTTITANQAGDANYNAAPGVGRDLEIVPALQTITFDALPAKTFGAAPFALGATASSGLAVSYTSSNAAVATVSGNTVTIVGAGTTTITATQAGNANFGAAPPVPRDLVVNKAAAPIALGGLAATFDGSAKAATATTTPPGLTVTFTYTPTGGAPSATPPTNAGSYAVAATVVDNNYEGTQNGTLVIAKAPQTITFGALAAKTFGDAAFALTATASSGLPVAYASSAPAVASVAGSTVTILTGGSTTITASQAGSDNYLPAADVAQSLVVSKAAATVTLDAGTLNQVYTGQPRVVTATTAPAGLTYAVTYTGNATVPTNAGSYPVVATVDDPRYSGSASGTLTVAKADQTITFAALPSKPLDSGNFTLTATASSGLPITYTSSDPTTASVSGSTVSLVKTGTVTLTAAQAGDSNYNAATSVDRDLVVLNQSQTITFEATQLPAKTFGDAPIVIQATSNRGLLVGFASSNSSVATVGASTLTGGVSSATLTIIGAGTATITASQPGDSNTAAAGDVAHPLTVAKAAATVTLGSLAATYDGTPRAATATTTPAGLNVVFAYGAAPGSPTAPTDVGTYPVTATIQENNYSGSASGSLVVAKANQTITFPAAGSPKLINAAPFALGATASSALAVAYTSSNLAVATVSGSTVTVVGLGTTTLTARQAGNANYNAAADVTQTLVVNPVAPVIVSAPATVPAALRGSAFVYGPVVLNPLSAPATFSATGLPAGVSVNPATGTISGTPTAEGTFNVTLTVTNATGSDSRALTIVVQPPAPVFTSAAAASAVAGTAFSYTATATPATGVTFSATGLPGWLTFTPATGVLAGTPTEAGVITVTLTATNTTGATSLPLVISTTLPANAPAYVGPLSLSGTAGTAFTFTPNFGTGATTYVLTGALPTGITAAGNFASTGTLAGTPTQVGAFPIAIAATRAGLTATANLVLTINPAATAPVVAVTGGNVRSATVGTAFGPVALTASPAATSFSIGALPAGLTVGGTATAPTLGGTPTIPGTTEVVLTATNSAGTGPATVLVITVNPHPNAPVLTSPAIVPGRVGTPLNYSLAATPVVATTYALTGTLPAGLVFDGNAGTVAGTPAAGSQGNYPVFIAGTNANGIGLALEVTFAIAPPLSVPVVTSSGTAIGQVGQAFSYQITASNTPTSFGATGLPAGLSLNATSGVISGVPTADTGAQPAAVVLTATNGDGTSAPKALALTIAPAPATPVITSAGSATGRVGAAFSYPITASGSPTSYVALDLPAGLTVAPATGIISGTPTVAGVFTASIRAANAAGLGAASPLALVIGPAATAPVISSPASAVGQVGATFSYAILAAPAPITGYAHTGTLPAGLTLNTATGVIAGSPTAPGVFTVQLTATGDGGTSLPQALTLLINPAAGAPVITSAFAVAGNVGAGFSYQITATNAPHLSLDAVNLPAGLAVNPFTGVIQGTPVAVGVTTASLVATNAAGTGPARDLIIAIQPAATAPVITSPGAVAAQVGVALVYQITATGAPTSYEMTGAPPWMTINPATGALGGIPTAPGTFTVSLLASNAAGTSAPLPLTLNVAAAAGTPVVTSSRTASGRVGALFAGYAITTAPAATTYAATGLPPGLGLDPATGAITGTPTASGIYPATLSASNASGAGQPVVVVFTIAANIVFGQ